MGNRRVGGLASERENRRARRSALRPPRSQCSRHECGATFTQGAWRRRHRNGTHPFRRFEIQRGSMRNFARRPNSRKTTGATCWSPPDSAPIPKRTSRGCPRRVRAPHLALAPGSNPTVFHAVSFQQVSPLFAATQASAAVTRLGVPVAGNLNLPSRLLARSKAAPSGDFQSLNCLAFSSSCLGIAPRASALTAQAQALQAAYSVSRRSSTRPRS